MLYINTNAYAKYYRSTKISTIPISQKPARPRTILHQIDHQPEKIPHCTFPIKRVPNSVLPLTPCTSSSAENHQKLPSDAHWEGKKDELGAIYCEASRVGHSQHAMSGVPSYIQQRSAIYSDFSPGFWIYYRYQC